MKGSARIYNLLSTLVMGLTVFVCLAMAVIFANPNVPFNPFKPASPDDLPALVVTVAPAPTALPGSTLRAPAAATKTEPPPSATMPSADTPTVTPFPSPVGPTDTNTPTDIPTQTSTLPPPTASATRRSYPGAATEPPPTDTPRPAYP